MQSNLLCSLPTELQPSWKEVKHCSTRWQHVHIILCWFIAALHSTFPVSLPPLSVLGISCVLIKFEQKFKFCIIFSLVQCNTFCTQRLCSYRSLRNNSFFWILRSSVRKNIKSFFPSTTRSAFYWLLQSRPWCWRVASSYYVDCFGAWRRWIATGPKTRTFLATNYLVQAWLHNNPYNAHFFLGCAVESCASGVAPRKGYPS